jgi:hypothetical protein
MSVSCSLKGIRFSAIYTMAPRPRFDRRTLGVVVALGLVVFLLIRSSSFGAAPTIASRVEQDSKRDVARFTPQNSLDISMAMGLTSYDPARMLNPPGAQPPQLLYPPSSMDLEKLCGV